MTASVNENCISCGLCASTCPEIFSMQGNMAVARPETIPDTLLESAAEAKADCPVEAIELTETFL